jgi:hypothetical protein
MAKIPKNFRMSEEALDMLETIRIQMVCDSGLDVKQIQALEYAISETFKRVLNDSERSETK